MISIVIPCYNSEKTIADTVRHLLDQSCSDFEIILVDDGSTDSTPQMCDEYAQADERIVVIHQENAGLMRAWKNGVIRAGGDYIAFCDADDYLESDFIERMYDNLSANAADMVLYGMVLDYERGSSIYHDNRIEPGYYDKARLNTEVYPILFSDGTMESWAIGRSRCSKLIRRELLMNVMPVLSDDISLGEDDLTTLATILNADNVFCIGGYYPYHYVRNTESMIGRYDDKWYEKLTALKREFYNIAEKYGYQYMGQIEDDFFSTVILYIKKDICNNPGGYKSTHSKYRQVYSDDEFKKCISGIKISGYGFAEKVFAYLAIHKWFAPLYMITRCYNSINGRSV